MANKVRGETTVEIGGVSYTISLGMGALAEIEDAFNVESFEEALDFTGKVSVRRLIKLLHAILVGNEIEITDDMESAIKRLKLDEFMRIVTELVTVPGLTPVATGETSEASGPLAVKNAGKRG